MTTFTDLVGCSLPVQQAAMSGIATPRLAAAVAEAGGLGMLGVGRPTIARVVADLDELDRLTERPVGVGLLVEFLEPEILEVVVDRRHIIEFFWGWPDPSLVPADHVVGWQVGSVDEARAAVDAGCRYIVVQGIEAGGHVRGVTERDELLATTRLAVGDDVAIVAAGGIGTAADVRAALERGADGVRVGSRFVAADESDAHDRYVELLTDSVGTDTELSEAFWVGWPDAAHRVLTSAVDASGDGADVIGRMPGPDGSMRPVPRFFVSPPTREFDGNIDAMALYAGMGIDAITGRVPAAEILADLTSDLPGQTGR
ncbi:MAG: nitronate monooxygenase [Ilumatobacteraceae bacterium]